MTDQQQGSEAASPPSILYSAESISTYDSSDQYSADLRSARRMSLNESTKSSKVRYRNSASLSPSLDRRRMSPSSPNLNATAGASLLSPKELNRIAPYASNSFDMLDTIGTASHAESLSPAPCKTASTPPIVGKKKKKHKSNKSTQFTPPQSPVSSQRRRSLNNTANIPTEPNGAHRQPLSTNGHGKRAEHYNNQHMRSNPPKHRRSLISRAPAEDYNDTTDLSKTENKENHPPSTVSESSNTSEQTSGRSADVSKEPSSRKPTETDTKEQSSQKPSFSIWDYLKDELTASDFDSAQDLKRERITNLLGVPGAVEKVSLQAMTTLCLSQAPILKLFASSCPLGS